MTTTLVQTIPMLDRDLQVTAQRLDEYWELQKYLSSGSSQVVQSVIADFRVLERGIVSALLELRSKQKTLG